MVNPIVSAGDDNTTSVGGDVSPQSFSNKRINVCLDDTNFLLWKQQVILTIRGLGLEAFIDPDTLKPVKVIDRASGDRIVNHAYTQFVKQDSSLASWLLSTVSSDILPQLVEAKISSEIWSVIQGLHHIKLNIIMHNLQSNPHA
ncbi:hypothetical protein HRI_004734600 [Hibiscus trionum]|uniref:Retrotransposon Copia-like N-terminal domain-containing protein n=1 Tax=Hibiscus trionum TaxID=183268 RepID=A0A9W7JC04_HIBTR|nr:hypothetical protein HRI_004734600 [Hibiscus trionum]